MARVLPPPQPAHQDPGLQPERTVLSWSRTLLAMCVVAMLFVRWYPTAGWIVLIPLALCGVTSVLVLVSQRRRYHRQAEGITREGIRPDLAAVWGLAAMTLIIAVSGMLAVWVAET